MTAKDDSRARSILDALERDLAAMDLDAAPLVESLPEQLAAAFGGVAFVARPVVLLDGFGFAWFHAAGPTSIATELEREARAMATTRPGERPFASFDPLRPKEDHRNVVAWPRPCHGTILGDVFDRAGVGAYARLRVLVCEGPLLLAWVKVMRAEPFSGAERAWFERLVPALALRLALERQITGAPGGSAFDAAFDAIDAPAYLVMGGDAIEHANEQGAIAFAREPEVTRARLRAVLETPSEGSVATLETASGPPRRLVVLRTTLGERLARAAERWQLTPRELDVLAQLARGGSNKEIAASLGTSKRTIDIHVGSLLVKARAESRTKLIARLATE